MENIVLYCGLGEPVSIPVPVTIQNILYHLNILLGIEGFRTLKKLIGSGVVFYFRPHGYAIFEPVDSQNVLNNKEFKEGGTLTWRKVLKMFSFSQGVGTNSIIYPRKHYALVLFESDLPDSIPAKLKEFERMRLDPKFEGKFVSYKDDESGLQLTLCESKMPSMNHSFSVRCVNMNTKIIPEIEATAADFFMHNPNSNSDKVLHYYPLQSSYSACTLASISSKVQLPSNLQSKYLDVHLSSLSQTESAAFVTAIDRFVEHMCSDAKHAHRWDSIVGQCFDQLYLIQPSFPRCADFNESVRRRIVNIVVDAAATYCGVSAEVEVFVWSTAESVKYSNICGYGPLDYLINGSRVDMQDGLTVFSDPEYPVKSLETAPSQVEALSGEIKTKKTKYDRPSRAYATLPPFRLCGPSPTCVVTTRLSPLGIDDVLSDVKRKAALNTDQEDDNEEEELDEDAAAAKNVKVSSNEYGAKDYCFGAIRSISAVYESRQSMEACEAETDNKAAQLLAQMHDMHLTKGPVVATVASLAHKRVYGSLTSGQTYHYFRSDMASEHDKSHPTYLGSLYLPVLRAERDKDSSYNRISWKMFQRVVAATVMAMMDELKAAKEYAEQAAVMASSSGRV